MLAGEIDKYNHMRDNLIASGKEADNLDSSIKSKLKDAVEDGSMSIQDAKKYMKDYLGMSKLDRYSLVNKWKEKSDYEDLSKAIKKGDDKKIKKYLKLLYADGKGKSENAIKSGISSQLKGEFVYNFWSGKDYKPLASNILYTMNLMGTDYSESIERWICSAECYKGLIACIARGYTDSARKAVYNLNHSEDKKPETILRAIEGTYKPMYVYMKNSGKDTKSLKKILVALAGDLGKNRKVYSNEIDSWK